MNGIKNQILLEDKGVQAEIARHRWIESEKAGSDIGFEQASRDWLMRYSDDWIKSHRSQKETSGRSAIRVVRDVLKAAWDSDATGR